jgi:hypothetical protein
MLHDEAACRENHERFIARVLESEIVWGLRGPTGFADCDSNDVDKVVLMFWSDRAYASRVRQQSFPEFEPAEVSLLDFLFRWLPGMARDDVLVGTNWTGDLAGLEFDPAQLQGDLVAAMSPEQFQKLKARLEAELEK